MGQLDKNVFGNKKFSDLLEEIYNNQKKKEEQISYTTDDVGTKDQIWERSNQSRQSQLTEQPTKLIHRCTVNIPTSPASSDINKKLRKLNLNVVKSHNSQFSDIYSPNSRTEKTQTKYW